MLRVSTQGNSIHMTNRHAWKTATTAGALLFDLVTANHKQKGPCWPIIDSNQDFITVASTEGLTVLQQL
jgi:hypothetical protein